MNTSYIYFSLLCIEEASKKQDLNSKACRFAFFISWQVIYIFRQLSEQEVLMSKLSLISYGSFDNAISFPNAGRQFETFMH
jgi:hypothetical protein